MVDHGSQSCGPAGARPTQRLLGETTSPAYNRKPSNRPVVLIQKRQLQPKVKSGAYRVTAAKIAITNPSPIPSLARLLPFLVSLCSVDGHIFDSFGGCATKVSTQVLDTGATPIPLPCWLHVIIWRREHISFVQPESRRVDHRDRPLFTVRANFQRGQERGSLTRSVPANELESQAEWIGPLIGPDGTLGTFSVVVRGFGAARGTGTTVIGPTGWASVSVFQCQQI